jgi:hypothetical protein
MEGQGFGFPKLPKIDRQEGFTLKKRQLTGLQEKPVRGNFRQPDLSGFITLELPNQFPIRK